MSVLKTEKKSYIIIIIIFINTGNNPEYNYK